MATQHKSTAAFAFGLLGNIVSFITFLAPLPTFYEIYKKKSTQGFQSIPYVVSLLSAMLLLYYGLVKKDTLLITISGIGCVIETAYVIAYLIYALKNDRMFTLKLFLSMNVLGFGVVLSTTFFLSKGANRARIIGWISSTVSVLEYAAPLCIMVEIVRGAIAAIYIFLILANGDGLSLLREVIEKRSVEFMPITLSIFLTLDSIVWFFYGFLLKNYVTAVPNALGFVLGGVQMMLYAIYKKNAKKVEMEPNLQLQELGEEIIDVEQLSTAVCQELNPVLATQSKDDLKDSVGEDDQIVEMPSKAIKA